MIPTITRYSRLRDTQGIRQEIDWRGLFKEFSKPGPYQGDEDHPGWSAADLDPCRRKGENVKGLCALVLDYEPPDLTRAASKELEAAKTRRKKGPPHTCRQALETWEGTFGFLHTTKKHQEDPPPDKVPVDTRHRFRVVLPLPRWVTRTEYPHLWVWASSLVPGALDPAPKDLSRFWYEPAIVGTNPFFAQVMEGEYLNVDSILRQAVSVQVPAALIPEPTPTPPAAVLFDDDGPAETPVPTAESEGYPECSNGPGVSKYAASALAQACEKIRNAPRGTRNPTMSAEAFAMGGLVASGELTEDAVKEALWDATVLGDWDKSAAMKTHTTLERQLRAGMGRPRTEASRAALHGGGSIGPEPGRPANGATPGGYGGASPLGLFGTSSVGQGVNILGASRVQVPPMPVMDLRGLRGAALAIEPPPRIWLCRGIHLTRGRPFMVHAFGGSGKTWLGMDLALAVATGGKTWGTFNTARGDVVHLNYEMEEDEVLRRYQRLAFGLGIDLTRIGESLEILSLRQLCGFYILPTPEVRATLVKLLTGKKLCIIDSLRAACPGLNEDKSEARFFLDLLLHVSEETGCAIVVLHHSPKPSTQSGKGNAPRDAIFNARGSGGLVDACATTWDVTSESGALRLKMGKASFGQRIDEAHHVRLVDSGDKNPSTDQSRGIHFEWLPQEQVKAERDEVKAVEKAHETAHSFAAVQTAIVDLLKVHTCLTGNAIVKGPLLSGHRAHRAEALRQLVASGVVAVSEGPNRSQIHSLTTPPTQEDTV